MLIPLFFLLFAGVFVLQLLLCAKGQTVLRRGLLLILLCALEAVCWILYGWASVFMAETFGASFTAWIGALLVLYLIAASVLAWLVWAIVRFAQKRRK